MYNIRELAQILVDNDIFLNSVKCNNTDLEDEDDICYLEERVGSSEYSEFDEFDFYLTWNKEGFTAFIDLNSIWVQDAVRCGAYFDLKISHYSISVKSAREYFEMAQYIYEAEQVVKKINERANFIKMWR